MGKQKMVDVVGVNGSNGKKQSKASMLKLQHLKNVAMWSSGDVAAIPSLASFFGRRFASFGDSLGMPTDDSLIMCERCETILHPGDNCTVRIETNKRRKCRKHKGSKVPTQNNVVYNCHFCSHQTVKRGTLKGHMKRICPPKDKTAIKPKVINSILAKSASSPNRTPDSETFPKDSSPCIPTTIETLVTEFSVRYSDNTSSALEVATIENVESEFVPATPAPVTPQVGTNKSLLDAKKRPRNKSGKKEPGLNSVKTEITGTVSSTKKRKRKTVTSLKDLVKSSQSSSNKNIPDISIPFFL